MKSRGGGGSGQWVDDHTYFVDENGCMIKNQWIYKYLGNDNSYTHSYTIPASLFHVIDMEHLSYVGYDGKIVRNKIIYFTPFRFDNNGYCSLSEDDIAKFENAEYGIEGWQRYAIFNGSYKEYY